VIVPVLQDAALLADIADANLRDGHVHLWWLGQSGFLVQFEGRHLLLDPYLSDSLTEKYADTDKPHVRMTARAVDPSSLDFVDVVTSSHNHTDHLDAATLVPLLRLNPDVTLIVAAANRAFAAERLRIDPSIPVGLAIGDAVSVGPFRVEAVPAAHEVLDPQYVGYVVRCGPWTLYHSGDTVLYEGMADRLRPYAIDVALLPINGRAPERRVAGNLSAAEAADLGKAIGARTVIPCHYEMFAFNTADPADFVAACTAVGQRGDVLRCGERWSTAALDTRATRHD
jgi:L-ascorbate metabolism protein UlaG (beta-lactamase superfamily)